MTLEPQSGKESAVRKHILGSLAALLAGAGLATAQVPQAVVWTPAAPPRPAVTLGQPVALEPADEPHADPLVVRASASEPADVGPAAGPAPLFRAAMDALPPPPPPPPLPPPPPPAAARPWFGGGDPCKESKCWVSGEYLYWWVQHAPVPVPLATTSPIPGAGTTLFGGHDVDYGNFSGLRFTAGSWFCDCIGGEGSFFLLEQRRNNFTASGSTPLFIPVNSAVVVPGLFPMGPTTIPISTLGVPTSITDSSSIRLWGLEADGLYKLVHNDKWHADLLAGFRYVDLREDLSLSAQAVATDTLFTGLTAVASLNDDFHTQNQFYGVQVGGKVGAHLGKFTADFIGKAALGVTHEIVDINGFKSASIPALGVVAIAPGGIFAQPTNTGNHSQNQFAVVPEAQLQLGYFVTPRLKVYAGYTFLYISSVVRPGNQINPLINLNQLVTPGAPTAPLQPSFGFKDSSFWAQGLDFGVEFRF